MPVYPQKKRVCNIAEKSATNQPLKTQPSQWHGRAHTSAGTFPGFHQGHHCPIVVQLSWQRIHEIMSDNTCAFVRLHKVYFCTNAWILKRTYLQFALLCKYVRSFAGICALCCRLSFRSHNHRTQTQKRNSLKQAIWLHNRMKVPFWTLNIYFLKIYALMKAQEHYLTTIVPWILSSRRRCRHAKHLQLHCVQSWSGSRGQHDDNTLQWFIMVLNA